MFIGGIVVVDGSRYAHFCEIYINQGAQWLERERIWSKKKKRDFRNGGRAKRYIFFLSRVFASFNDELYAQQTKINNSTGRVYKICECTVAFRSSSVLYIFFSCRIRRRIVDSQTEMQKCFSFFIFVIFLFAAWTVHTFCNCGLVFSRASNAVRSVACSGD